MYVNCRQKQEMMYTAEAIDDLEHTLTIKFTDGPSLGNRIQKLLDHAKDLKLTLDDVNKNGNIYRLLCVVLVIIIIL
jgi:hypothetical protein